MKFLKKIAGKTRCYRERSVDIWKLIKQELIKKKIERSQLRWYGHFMKMRKNALRGVVGERNNDQRR